MTERTIADRRHFLRESMAMGQAAGMTAALAAARGTTPGDVPLGEVRSGLREHGAIVPA